MASPLDLVTGKAAAWALLALLVISVGLGVSQYVRANAAEKKLDACRTDAATKAGQIELQNESLRKARQASQSAREDADRLLAEAKARSALDAERMAALQARLKSNSTSKTCTDAMREIRQGWRAAS